ncbi:SseB family protein [Thermomonas brevis]|nr:enhanced serine sensitivity protein SseB C-terminal domain-containing protein [Xanthomonadales bacterium]
MQLAIADKAAEPAFFRALLEATVYAHAPRHDRSGRLRFIQFTTPDGLTVLPFFSDETQAKSAAGANATVVVLLGRQLFELARGATFMLNPNTVSCTLYPEEVAALLDRGEVAVLERVEAGEHQYRINPLDEIPAWVVDHLLPLFAALPCVSAAYAVEIGNSDTPGRGLLIAVAVPIKDAERVARATTTALQTHADELQLSVDLTAFEPGEVPDWLADAVVAPFYERAIGERLVPGSARVQ